MDKDKKTWKRKSFHSEEAKRKIGIGNKKAYKNPLLRKYLSDSQKGQHHSIKTEFKKGHGKLFDKEYVPWNKGKKYKFNKTLVDGKLVYIPKTKEKHYSRNWQRNNRIEVIKKLGNKCVKCGFSDWRALQIDHVNGGGRQELMLIKMGTSAYYKKVMKDKTGSYQLLCANCNWIKKYENNENAHYSKRNVLP